MNKLIVIFLLLLAITVQAQDNSSYFLGGGVGYAYISHNTQRIVNDNIGPIFNADTGYNFNKYFAIDIGTAVMIHQIYIRQDLYSSQQTVFNLSDLALKITVPISPIVDAHLKSGPGVVLGNQYIENGKNFGVFMGLGVDFKISSSLALTVDDYGIFMPKSIAQNVNALGLGVMYEF